MASIATLCSWYGLFLDQRRVCLVHFLGQRLAEIVEPDLAAFLDALLPFLELVVQVCKLAVPVFVDLIGALLDDGLLSFQRLDLALEQFEFLSAGGDLILRRTDLPAPRVHRLAPLSDLFHAAVEPKAGLRGI